jgi:hypothetical protein
VYSSNSLRRIGRQAIEITPSDTPIKQRISASMGVLKVFLGSEWFGRHLGGVTHPFFCGTEPKAIEAGFRRLWHLADMLINFQHIENFQHALSKLRNDNLEAEYGAFEAAHMLFRSAIPFRFVVEGTIRPFTYDLEAYPSGSNVTYIEAKTAMQSTDLTAKWMLNRLNEARSQLPPGKPGVIFIRLPRDWGGQDWLSPPFVEVVEDRLRSSSRLAAVILYSDTLIVTEELRGKMTIMKEFYSKRPQFSHVAGWKLTANRFAEPGWKTVASLLHIPMSKLGENNPIWTIEGWKVAGSILTNT